METISTNENSQNTPMGRDVTPTPPTKKKKWLNRVLIIIGTVVVVLAGIFIYLFITVNPETGPAAFSGIKKIKCERQGKIFAQGGWSTHCYPKASDAGKACIQNSECLGGACRPSATFDGLEPQNEKRVWDGTPQEDSQGNLLGHCDEIDYKTYYSGMTSSLSYPPGCSLQSPVSVEMKTPNIGCVLE